MQELERQREAEEQQVVKSDEKNQGASVNPSSEAGGADVASGDEDANQKSSSGRFSRTNQPRKNAK